MTKAHETANPKTFHFPIRVYYEDTDAGGVVYHPNYLNFALRARIEFEREHGYTEKDIIEKLNVLLVVRHVEIDYRAPSRLDDLLDVSVEIVNIGNTSITIRQEISRDGQVLAEVNIVLVAVSIQGKAVRIPPQLRQILGWQAE